MGPEWLVDDSRRVVDKMNKPQRRWFQRFDVQEEVDAPFRLWAQNCVLKIRKGSYNRPSPQRQTDGLRKPDFAKSPASLFFNKNSPFSSYVSKSWGNL